MKTLKNNKHEHALKILQDGIEKIKEERQKIHDRISRNTTLGNEPSNREQFKRRYMEKGLDMRDWEKFYQLEAKIEEIKWSIQCLKLENSWEIKWEYEKWPKVEKKEVLVALQSHDGLDIAIAVGYIRYQTIIETSEKEPIFITPGVDRKKFEVVAWSNCLKGFKFPEWRKTKEPNRSAR